MIKKTLLLILGLLAMTGGAVFAGTWPINLPQTGQTKCYSGSNPYNEISCTGTGQDGELQQGVSWPYPRFILLTDPPSNGNVVMDNLTGLMWFKYGHAPETIVCNGGTIGCSSHTPGVQGYCTGDTKPWQWQDALTYVACINGGTTSPWRLPNVLELKSLMDSDTGDLVSLLNGWGFLLYYLENSGGTVNWYWSSTTLKNSSPSQAWSFNPIYQGEDFKQKSDTVNYHFTLPVQTGNPVYGSVPAQLPRSGQSTFYDTNNPPAGPADDGGLHLGVFWPSPRFIDNIDGTITDNLTGLMWTQSATLQGSDRSWQNALNYVASMNSGPGTYGYNDWRLPNRVELNSLVNYDQADNATWLLNQGFTNVVSASYWSSTTYLCSGSSGYSCGSTPTNSAWAITFPSGVLTHPQKNGNGYAWPVRGGSGLYGSAGISISAPSFSYPDTYIGFTATTTTFTITNTGTNNLYLNVIQKSGSDPDQFPILNDTCSLQTIAPGGTCSFDVKFFPTSSGAKSASFNVTSNSPVPFSDVTLSGTALDDITSTPDSNGDISCNPVSPGYTGTSTCTITPHSGFVISNVMVGATGSTLGSVGAVASYQLTNMLSPMTITATFFPAPVKRIGTTTDYHSCFSEALGVAGNGNIIMGKSTGFVESLIVDKTVTLKGGYDTNWNPTAGTTTINGTVTIRTGSLAVQGIVIGSDPWAAVTAAIEAVVDQFPGDPTANPPGPAGLTVEVMTPAGVVYSRTFGGFTNTTYTPVGSASKIVSATVFLRLAEQGLLPLATYTKDVLIDSGTGQPWTGNMGNIQVHHLLSFTSGITSDVTPTESDSTITTQEAVQRIYTDLSGTASPPGSYFYYGGHTHLRIAARMAEIQTGKPWLQIFYEQMQNPLGWGQTSTFGGGTNPDPAQDLACTGLEYARFLMLQLRKGLDGPTRLVNEASIDLQRTDALGSPPASIPINYSPYTALGKTYHYGFCNWLETADGQAPSSTNPVNRWSSTGRLGWAPWVASDGSYAGLIMTRQVDTPTSFVPSENLKTQLEPLIRAALSQNPPVVRFVP